MGRKKQMDKSVTVTVRLEESLVERLMKKADKLEWSLSQVIRKIIEKGAK